MAAVGKPYMDKLNKTYAAFQSITEAAAIISSEQSFIIMVDGAIRANASEA